jgi:hypothetical protein
MFPLMIYSYWLMFCLVVVIILWISVLLFNAMAPHSDSSIAWDSTSTDVHHLRLQKSNSWALWWMTVWYNKISWWSVKANTAGIRRKKRYDSDDYDLFIYLFTCLLNSPKANYKLSMSKEQGNINNNSIKFSSLLFMCWVNSYKATYRDNM